MLNFRNVMKIFMLLFMVSFITAADVFAQVDTSDPQDYIDKHYGDSDDAGGSDPGVSGTTNTTPETNNNSGGSYDVSDSQCASKSGGNVFQHLACKAMSTLGDLRKVIYVLSGFGLIAFAFAAIFGKVSWKHLAQISASLFLVAMMAPFIRYFTGTGQETLKYGSYLPSNYAGITGNDMQTGRTDRGTVSQTITEWESKVAEAAAQNKTAIDEKYPVAVGAPFDYDSHVQNSAANIMAWQSSIEEEGRLNSALNAARYGDGRGGSGPDGSYTLMDIINQIQRVINNRDHLKNNKDAIVNTVKGLGDAIKGGDLGGVSGALARGGRAVDNIVDVFKF